MRQCSKSDEIIERNHTPARTAVEPMRKSVQTPGFQTISHLSDELINVHWFAATFFVVEDVIDDAASRQLFSPSPRNLLIVSYVNSLKSLGSNRWHFHSLRFFISLFLPFLMYLSSLSFRRLFIFFYYYFFFYLPLISFSWSLSYSLLLLFCVCFFF